MERVSRRVRGQEAGGRRRRRRRRAGGGADAAGTCVCAWFMVSVCMVSVSVCIFNFVWSARSVIIAPDPRMHTDQPSPNNPQMKTGRPLRAQVPHHAAALRQAHEEPALQPRLLPGRDPPDAQEQAGGPLPRARCVRGWVGGCAAGLRRALSLSLSALPFARGSLASRRSSSYPLPTTTTTNTRRRQRQAATPTSPGPRSRRTRRRSTRWPCTSGGSRAAPTTTEPNCPATVCVCVACVHMGNLEGYQWRSLCVFGSSWIRGDRRTGRG